jgi:hypothetical protein
MSILEIVEKLEKMGKIDEVVEDAEDYLSERGIRQVSHSNLNICKQAAMCGFNIKKYLKS